jgi:transposase
MFVRVKSTPNSPRKSIQIVESVRKGNKVSQKIVRYVGIAMDDDELEKLKSLAESIKIKLEADQQELLFPPEEMAKMKEKSEKISETTTDKDYQVDIRNLKEEQRVINGIQDVYGALFEELGFTKTIKNPARNKSSVEIFKDIVLARIANPLSKRASVDMLEEDFGVTLNLDRVYKMMDKLDDNAISKINDIAYQMTLNLFENKIDVIFYDCTTIYFEAFEEDELRKNGFSKDLKFNQPQVLLALMVTTEGLPIGYRLFDGSKYEGHTLIPVLQELKQKYNLNKVVFVADSGLMNEKNLEELENKNSLDEFDSSKIDYIVGARIKNLPAQLKKKILDLSNYVEINTNETGYKIASFDHKGRKLIVNYSPKRAKKDALDRQKSIERLEKKLAKQKNPNDYLSKFGNSKYLKLVGESSIELNTEKIEADSKWDGLLGVITNTSDFTREEIIKQYCNLWQVENAFRVTKHDLKVRPVYHWKPERVKAHIAISFVAYTMVKHLEYRVKLQFKKLSPEKIRQILIKVQTSIMYDSKKNIRYALPSKISLEAKKIYKIVNIPIKSTPYILEKCSAQQKK